MNNTWNYDGTLYTENSRDCICFHNLIFKYTESVKWPIRIAPSCGGEHQSPINIEPTQAVVTDYPRLSFVRYDKVFPETITNNGHTGIF
jgi:carbonic anhydrase